MGTASYVLTGTKEVRRGGGGIEGGRREQNRFGFSCFINFNFYSFR